MAPTFLCSRFLKLVVVGSFSLVPIQLEASEKNFFQFNPELISQDISKPSIELKLFSDRQYDLNEKLFVAEGNVKAYLKGAILKADRLEFDRNNKTLKAEGNIIFSKGSQYLKASSLEYDFLNETGELVDVYGVIAIKSLSNDLKLISSEEELIQLRDEIIEQPIKTIKLVDGYNISAGNITSKYNSILNEESDIGNINNWRIEAPKININQDGWFAKSIVLTNDPLNPVQTKIEATDVIAKEDIDQSISIVFGKSRLILEDKVSVPLLGKGKFGEGQKLQWVVGYDLKDRDGLFLGRQFLPLNLGDVFELSLQPQFLIQRSIKGKTNSYVAKGASPLGDKKEYETNISDLFGLKLELKGSKNTFSGDFVTEITTFDRERFSNGYRYKGNIAKDLEFNNIKDMKVSAFTSYRDKTWNGSLGESNIYYSSGIRMDKMGKFKSKKASHKYNLSLGSGHYEAEEFHRKTLIKQWKTNIYTSIDSNYPIYRTNKNQLTDITGLRYTPKPVNPGLDFNTKISSSYSLYSKGSEQALFKFVAGPELTLGNFKKSFLDFTRFSMMPGITIKDGSSPFKFDNDIDLRTISIELDQQIYGPLLLTAGLEYNIDERSNNYGKSLDSQAAIIFQRRSYGLGIFYQPYQKAGGIMFNLNGFSFDKPGSSFSI